MINLVKMELYRTLRAVSTWVIVACVVAIGVFATTMTDLEIETTRENDEQMLRDALAQVDGLNTESMSVEEMLPLLAQLENKELAADVYMNVTMGDAAIADMPIGDMGDVAEGFKDGLAGEESEDSTVDIVIGFQGQTEHDWVYGDINIWDLISSLITGGMPLLLLSIFVAIMANAEQKNGFIKNIAGQFPYCGMLVGSKLVMLILSVLSVLVLFSVTVFATGKFFWGERLVFGNEGTALKFFAIWFLLYLAFAGIVYVLCVISRGAALGMTMGILICTGFWSVFYMGLNMLMQERFGLEKFNIAKIAIENVLKNTTIFAESKDVIHAICVGAVYLVLTVGGAVFLMQKRDVR